MFHTSSSSRRVVPMWPSAPVIIFFIGSLLSLIYIQKTVIVFILPVDFTEFHKLWKVSVQNRKSGIISVYVCSVDCISIQKKEEYFEKNKYEIDMVTARLWIADFLFAAADGVSGIYSSCSMRLILL